MMTTHNGNSAKKIFRFGTAAAGILLALLLAYRPTKLVLAWVYDPTRDNPSTNVIVLSADWCPNCRQLKTVLHDSNIPYVERDVERTWAGHWAYRAVKAQGVPVTIIGSKVVVGFSQGKLSELQAAFEAAGYKV